MFITLPHSSACPARKATELISGLALRTSSPTPRLAQTDDYMLPSKRPLSAVMGSEPANTWQFNDDPPVLSEVIVWDAKTQTVVETVPVKRSRF